MVRINKRSAQLKKKKEEIKIAQIAKGIFRLSSSYHLTDRNSSSQFSLRKYCFCFSNLHVQCIKVNKLILYYFHTYIFDFVLHFSCLNGCVGWSLFSRLWDWNGLPLNTYISMYVRTKRCYNEEGSRTNYVPSSIPHITGIT